MKNRWKRVVSLLLALTMVLSLFCSAAWAAELGESDCTVQEEIAEALEAEEPEETPEEECPDLPEQQPEAEAEPEAELPAQPEENSPEPEQEVSRDSAAAAPAGAVPEKAAEEAPAEAPEPEEAEETGLEVPADVVIEGELARLDTQAANYLKKGVAENADKWFTTKKQQKQFNTKLNQVMKKLKLSGKSDYKKVKAIYDYICTHVTYDYKHLNDGSYTLKHTGYAALVKGTAVCQGYAILFERMAKKAGLTSRLITGANHAWNIVKIGKKYYNLDTTWDSGRKGKYIWFLKCDYNFTSHPRDKGYATKAFYKKYPMSLSDYGSKVIPTNIKTTVKYRGRVDYAKAFKELKTINAQRKKKGYKALYMDEAWMKYAVGRAQECSVNPTPQAHPNGKAVSPPGKKGKYTTYIGLTASADEITNYALSKKLTMIGIGCFVNSRSGSECWYYVVGNPKASTGKKASQPKNQNVNLSTQIVGPRYTLRMQMEIYGAFRNLDWSTDYSDGQLNLLVGEKIRLNGQFSQGKADVNPQTFTWSSSKPSVLTVDKNGVVKAVGEGTAKITIKSGSYQASVKVAVASNEVLLN